MKITHLNVEKKFKTIKLNQLNKQNAQIIQNIKKRCDDSGLFMLQF